MIFYIIGAPGTGKRTLQDILQNTKQINNNFVIEQSVLNQAKYQIIEEKKIQQINQQSGVILTYSVCKKETLEFINKLVNTINDKQPSFVLLLGTHLDDQKQSRQISVQAGIDFKNKINAKFYEISLKTYENMQDIISRIVKAVQKAGKDSQPTISQNLNTDGFVEHKLTNSSLLLPENNLYRANLAVCTQQVSQVEGIIETVLQRQTYVPARDNNTTIQCKITFQSVQDVNTISAPQFYGVLIFFNLESKQQFQQALQQLSALSQKQLSFTGLVGLLGSDQKHRIDTVEGIRNHANAYGINFYAEIPGMELRYIQYLRDQLKARILKGLKQLCDAGKDRPFLIQEKLRLQSVQDLEKQDWNPQTSFFFNQIEAGRYIEFVCVVCGAQKTGKKTLISNLLRGRRALNIADPKRPEVQFRLRLCLESELEENKRPIARICCYSVADEASFRQAEDLLRASGSVEATNLETECRQILVGCFKDTQNRQVPEIKGRKLRDEVHGLFYEVSNSVPNSESFQVFRKVLQSAALAQVRALDKAGRVLVFAVVTEPLNAEGEEVAPEPQAAPILVPPSSPGVSINAIPNIQSHKNLSTIYNAVSDQTSTQVAQNSNTTKTGIENLVLEASKSRIIALYAPEILEKAEKYESTIIGSVLDPEAMQQRIKQLQPTKGLIKAQRAQRDAKTKSKKKQLTKNLPYNKHSKQEDENKEIIILEIEIGDQVISLPIFRHSNAYQLAKQFAEDYGLSKQHLNQITAIILEKIEQYNQQHVDDVLEKRRTQHETRKFDVPTSVKKLNTTKLHNKPLFQFELQIGNKKQLIAYREGDTIEKLAESFITLTQINREQYYDYVYSQIQQCYALYQMRSDGLANDM